MEKKDFDNHTENIDYLKQSVIVCRENKSTYKYNNKSQYCVAKIKVDGGLLPNKEIKKCDWLLVNWDNGVSYFIELKGRDFRKAIEQIESSINRLLSDLSKLKVTVVNVRIVTTKTYPNFKQNNEYIKLNKQVKKTGGTFISQNYLLEETV
ncbi:MAG: hypothetical protein LBE18_05780 [Planctomycetaceae bacterium]|jgi:hypothetical protein|nr:hypothetical protein [Planctomycetaceae bacterium]